MSEYLISGIGKHIKKLRKEKKLKLTVLAKLAGVSKGLVSKIENGRTVPSLPVLFSIINALELSPGDFFESLNFEPPQTYLHKRPEEFQKVKKEDKAKGFNYQLMMEMGFQDFSFEALTMVVLPGAEREPVSSDAYEFKYMLEGEVSYQIDEEEVTLKAGDCLLYEGRIPHVPHNTSGKPAKMLAIYFYKQKDKF